MNLAGVKKYLAISRKRKQIEEQLEAVKIEMRQWEQTAIERFCQAGVQSINVNGSTVWLGRKIVVRALDGDRDRLCEALRTAGLIDYIDTAPRFNTLSVEAWVKEQMDAGQEIPAAVAAALKVDEIFFLRVKNS